MLWRSSTQPASSASSSAQCGCGSDQRRRWIPPCPWSDTREPSPVSCALEPKLNPTLLNKLPCDSTASSSSARGVRKSFRAARPFVMASASLIVLRFPSNGESMTEFSHTSRPLARSSFARSLSPPSKERNGKCGGNGMEVKSEPSSIKSCLNLTKSLYRFSTLNSTPSTTVWHTREYTVVLSSNPLSFPPDWSVYQSQDTRMTGRLLASEGSSAHSGIP
mmetsp:Transcript_19011/g.34488  ORF Transcript_19011/g.34488 Transcript_19011/m.34488 type:complete len:220 (-) Transcript_19011:895-1554(-)